MKTKIMKTKITRTLLIMVLLMCYFVSNSQDLDISYANYIPEYQANKIIVDNGEIPYLVGSSTIPGYELEIRSCPIDESVTLSNGRRIGGLNCILVDKDDYIGGEIIFNGNSTKIISISIITKGNDAEFIVNGENFSMSLTLSNGTILELEDNYSTFNTNNIGIWSIYKKN